jgi:hypothetical protein
MKAHGLYATAGNKATPVTMKLTKRMQGRIRPAQSGQLSGDQGLKILRCSKTVFERIPL